VLLVQAQDDLGRVIAQVIDQAVVEAAVARAGSECDVGNAEAAQRLRDEPQDVDSKVAWRSVCAATSLPQATLESMSFGSSWRESRAKKSGFALSGIFAGRGNKAPL